MSIREKIWLNKKHFDWCPLSWWCYQTFLSSVTPFSSRLPSFLASGSFLMNLLFTSGGQSIGVSAPAAILPMNIQGWFPLGLTGLILQSKGLSRTFSITTDHMDHRLIFYVWEDASICIHWIHSFHVHLSYLGPNPASWLFASLVFAVCVCVSHSVVSNSLRLHEL